MSESAKRILDLRSTHTNAVRLRADAAASLRQAKKNREDLEKELLGLGIKPENAEVELNALETQLLASIDELMGVLNSEIAVYNEIVQKTGGLA